MVSGYYIFRLITLCQMLILIRFVDGRRLETIEKKELPKHEGIIKTIQTRYGETIDCVDINKQPAFNHPLLKNHTIQMKPDVLSRITETDDNNKMLLQSQNWRQDEECPEGSIPILRTQSYNHPQVLSRKQLNQSLASGVETEYAEVSMDDGDYIGVRATINIWKPYTEEGEFSKSQIWFQAGSGNDLNVIEAGWMVESGGLTKLFTYWTADAYQKTGCYNFDCPGFVQSGDLIVLGWTLSPISEYDGNQTEIVIEISKREGNWWLIINNLWPVGYWPRSLFTTLADRATTIKWGGQISNSKPGGHHTTTDMGSGNLPDEGFRKASYFKRLEYLSTADSDFRAPINLYPYASNPSCYSVQLAEDNTDNEIRFYYGGPGYYSQCQ